MAFRYNDIGPEVAGGPFKKGRFAFPIEDRDRYASKLQFQVIKINPPKVQLGFNVKGTLAEIAAAAADRDEAPELDTVAAASPPTLSLGSKCDLYLPQSMQITDTIAYGTPEFGIAGGAALSELQSGGAVSSSVAAAISRGTQGISDFVLGLKTGEFGRLGAIRAAGLIPGETAQNIASLTSRAALNPNVRALFRQVGLRRFTFAFKLIPVSAEESTAIKDIINFFRYHAYPGELVKLNGVSLGFEYPELFRIKAFTKVNGQYVQNGTHMKDCYLESFSTTFNPTSATFHPDGTPTEVDISLNFLEHRTISKSDIENPFNFRDSPANKVPLTDQPAGVKVKIIPNATTNTEGSF